MIFIVAITTFLLVVIISSHHYSVSAWLGCTDPPKYDPHMIDTALKKFYENCDGPNWPAPYNSNWVNKNGLCALDGDLKKHPYPYGVQCVIGGWHKPPPDADGGIQHMEIFSGKIAGGPIPDEFKSFQMIDWIGLWNNQITGNLWDTSYLTFIHRLDLSHNKMSGVIDPNTFFTHSKTHMELLNLGYNGFSGPIPNTMNNLETMSAIVLNNNKFSGPIPDLSHLFRLRQLNLASNQLTGTVGPWLKELSALSILNLDNNPGISGALPTLPNSIMRFQASNTGFTGTIPDSYGDLPLLRHFNCTGCRDLKCPKPDLLAHLSYSSHCKPVRTFK